MIEKIEKAVDLAIKAEIHAFVLLLTGAVLALKGHQSEALIVLGAAAGVFKGKIS
jgi:hypothetical protein